MHIKQNAVASTLHAAPFPQKMVCQIQHGLHGGKNNQGNQASIETSAAMYILGTGTPVNMFTAASSSTT